MNLDILRLRGALGIFNAMPESVREPIIRDQLQRVLDSTPGGPTTLGMLIGLVRDVLPRDEMLRAAFNVFAEELWRWWRDGGGK